MRGFAVSSQLLARSSKCSTTLLAHLAPTLTVMLVASFASAQPADDEPPAEAADDAADAPERRPEADESQDAVEGAETAAETESEDQASEVSADSWNDDEWFEQAEPDTPATEAAPPGETPLEVEASVGNVSRSFSYSEDLSGLLQSYSAPSGLLLGGSLTWFPAAHFTAHAPSHLGLAGHFELGLPQSTADGIGASMMQWRAGLVGRVPLHESHLIRDGQLLGRVEGGQHRFVVDDDPNRGTLVPAVEYDYLRVGLGARMRFSKRFFTELEAGVRFPFDAGPIAGPQWFPRAQATGMDGSLRLGLRFGPVDLLLGGAHERYFFSFDPTPEGPNPAGIAAGATDAYWDVTLGVRYALPPPKM